MPQSRYSKDSRGYENTFIVSSRGKGKGRSRIIYWFRTPPGVRVGRSALDATAIRQLEDAHPDLEFDWPQLLKGRQEGQERPKQEPPARPPRQEKAERRQKPGRQDRPEATRDVLPQETGARPAPAVEAPAPVAESPAGTRLGAKGLARLRARYNDLLLRIRDRVVATERQEELKRLAHRLNPDDWLTDADVVAGLESYEASFEALKVAIGPRPTPPQAEVAPTPQADPIEPQAEVSEPRANPSDDEAGDQ